MANKQIYISIVDTDWPRLKIIVNLDNREVKTAVAQYDICTSQFTPMVQDALRTTVEAVLKQHKVK